MHIRTGLILIGSIAAALTIAPIHAASDVYSIDAHILSAGSSVTSVNTCYRMQSTIAEPVAGFSSSTDYSISAGFRASTQGVTGDDIFFNSFEDCTP